MASIERPLCCAAAHDTGAQQVDEKATVDPFLVELLENPRYRLIVLRMELDIQKFVQNPDLQEFEFQHLPTSYLRCAAHRVAQHYGLETTVSDSIANSSSVNGVIAKKTPSSKFPSLALSKIPPKQAEGEVSDMYKIVLRQRPNTLTGDAMGTEAKKDLIKSIEEREEEYDKARARIFNGSRNIADKEVPLSNTQVVAQEAERNSGKVAVFRDREKDRHDPDYDRCYERYVRSPLPAHNFPMVNQPQFVPFVGDQTGINYGPSDPTVSSFSAFGSHQASINAFYAPWPTPAMMYTNCYGNLTHVISQVPFCQGFDHPRYS